MAYFLDPELAALAPGGSRRGPQPTAPAVDPTRRPNRYGKRCHGCGTWVPEKKGYLGNLNGAWVVYCTTCP